MASSNSEPLLRGSLDDTARSLLESAQDDSPPVNGRERMLAALAATPAATESSSRFRELFSSGGYTMHGIGLVLVLAASAAIIGTSSWGSRSESVASVQPAPSAPVHARAIVTAAARADRSESANTLPVFTPDALPSAPEVASAQKIVLPKRAIEVAAPPSPAPSAPTSTLAREIAVVEAARTTLASGNATSTLAQLDQYDREFPAGAFAVEVAVLRIEALSRAGRTDEARRLGTRFLATHPQGAFARRVAVTLGAPNVPPSAASASSSDGE